jgi:ABC-type Fe3+-siderophore transport system permease subunit
MFLAVTALLLVSSLIATPRQAAVGLVMMAVGVPFYLFWSRRVDAAAS